MWNWVEREKPGYTGWVFDEGSGKWFQKSSKLKKSNVKKQMNTKSVMHKKRVSKSLYNHRSSKYGV
jgi:hypothetical protein